MNENPITRVFVAPSKMRKPLRSVFEMVFPRIAAWPLPNPGRRLERGDAISAPIKGEKIFPFIFGFVISCFGMLVLH